MQQQLHGVNKKRSMSVRKMTELFDRYDGRITVISFDAATGARVMTYQGLNLFQAMQEVTFRTSVLGQIVRVCLDLPSDFQDLKTADQLDFKYLWLLPFDALK